ncbi:Neopullulanase SusA (Starch-utilization system protein A) [Durusdinium trenchii]|uniref:Neopullulanase SusA (Starch-utilization system protein A) n=1 Tax=Durusdinium trenchii TaxID=1381693 RepID=A0ABP0QKE0_9DINO
MDGRLITDRFADGDPSNNELRYGGFDVRDMTFRHGGDFRGLRLGAAQGGGGKRRMVEIRRKIEVEEVCRYEENGNGYNSYHQYSQLDFTLLDQRLGTKEELRRLTEQAHALGLYVSWMVKSGRRRRNAVISVVINEQLNMNRDCRRGDEPHEQRVLLRRHRAPRWGSGGERLERDGHKEGRAPWRMHETVQGREYLLLTRKPMEELHSTPAGRQPYMDFWYNNTWDPQAQYPGTLYGQHGEATVDVGHGTYESSAALWWRIRSSLGEHLEPQTAAAWELRRRSKKETEEIGFGVRQAMDVETRLRLLEAEVLQPSNQHRREGTQKLQEAVDLLEELMAGISKHFHFRQEALENIANGWSLALNGKLYGTMDDLRLEHRRVQQKYLARALGEPRETLGLRRSARRARGTAMSNAFISSCDVDGFRVDTPMQVPLVFYKAWVPAVKLRWQEDGRPLKGIFGEFYVTPERYSTMTGRGKDHAMYHRRVGSQAFEGCGGD